MAAQKAYWVPPNATTSRGSAFLGLVYAVLAALQMVRNTLLAPTPDHHSGVGVEAAGAGDWSEDHSQTVNPN